MFLIAAYLVLIMYRNLGLTMLMMKVKDLMELSSSDSDDALHPSHQFFSHIGTFSSLQSSWVEPVLSRRKVKPLVQGQNTMPLVSLEPATLRS